MTAPLFATPCAVRIEVRIDRQELLLFTVDRRIAKTYRVSTAVKGAGELYGSEMTPRGRHVVRAKIGDGAANNTVFVARRATGETWSAALASRDPGRDWMLTRILWLSGTEPGFNRFGRVDSMCRKIYIHGTGDESTLGRPASHGCVRMANSDVIELFNQVSPGTVVDLRERTDVPFCVRMVEWNNASHVLMRIRYDVFVTEQKVPVALELDGIDEGCRHALAKDESGAPIGCGRLLPDGHIGRMAVLSAWRNRGVGTALLQRLLDVARYAGFRKALLNAQTHALDFYAKHGFIAVGPEYDDAGIPHRAMARDLSD